MQLVHASTVEIGGHAVLIRGPSGAGKSDLALRLIDAGATLVSDDQTELAVENGRLFASAPATIAGLIEVRGLGLVRLPHRDRVPVGLAVDLDTANDIERLPEPMAAAFLGLTVPLVRLSAFESSAAAKVRLAMVSATRDIIKAVMTEQPSSDVSPQGDQGEAAARECGRLVVVTGLSGAGKTSALKVLEDLGYEAVDNLPVSLLYSLARPGDGPARALAVGIDIRTRDFGVEPVLAEIDRLMAEKDLNVRLLFLDCDDEVLSRRFTETRRRHPLAVDRPLADGIRHERALVSPLKRRADVVFDTSNLQPGEFKRALNGHFGLESSRGLMVFVTSFAYRAGLPREADLVFDCRFLNNPHYVPELQPLTGRDEAVAGYVAGDPMFTAFFEGTTSLVGPLLPRFAAEGKSYLTIAFGCTGGRHRSVFTAESMAAWLRESGIRVELRHRELEEGGTLSARGSK